MAITPTTARPTDGRHLPVLHLNGSGTQALLGQYTAMYAALDAACKAMVDAAPNGRDYYPKGDGAVQVAEREFIRRLRLVEQVRDDVMDDWLAVVDASEASRVPAPRR